MRSPSRFAFAFLSVAVLAGSFAHAAAPQPAPASTNHWAFQPVTRPSLPAVRNKSWPRTPIDFFILAKLDATGLAPSPPTDKATLLRRVTFDLHGLPPTPAELDAFLADSSPDAFAKVVDRLLASPRYGERWARHWLDLARFSESDGFEYDKMREHAWRYRDYVIRSLNEDKPYARFVAEQIAGDALEPVTLDGLAATGFLVAGPYDEAGNNSVSLSLKARIREEEMEDIIAAVGQTFLGVTVNCARCHDHKFDPISQTDYYRLKAALDGVRRGNRPFATPAETRAREEQVIGLKSRIAELESQITALESTVRARVAADEGRRSDGQANPKTNAQSAASPLTPALSPLRGEGESPAVAPPGVQGRLLTEVFTDEEREQRSRLTREIDRLRRELKASPSDLLVYAAVSRQPEPTFVLLRGDVDKKGEPVSAGALAAVKSLAPEFGLAADAPEARRRARLAQWMTDPGNPLTWRVIVNRVWQHHFGRGLVVTPNDFGAMGERPSHPELLDWLAAECLAQGGSIKKLHRLVVLSAVYQQSSAPAAIPKTGKRESKKARRREDTPVPAFPLSRFPAFSLSGSPRFAEGDSDNRLLRHYPLRRLEAEAVRDAMLHVSGQLNLEAGGPSFRPFKITVSNSHFYELIDATGVEYNRRSIYRAGIQSGKDPLLDSLDCPDPSTKMPARGVTTTPIQALSLMNNAFVQRQARHFAGRLISEAGGDAQAYARLAWRLAFGREPRREETREAAALVREHGLESLCWALLNSSEFLYVK